MISRRLLRVKVMQVYYAQTEKEINKLENALNELERSAGASLELYFFLNCLLLCFRDLEEERLEIASNKLVPTEEDLHPNTLFADNLVLKKLTANRQIQHYYKTDVFNLHENKEILKRLWSRIRESAYFRQYLEADDKGIKATKKIVTDILELEISVNEEIEQLIEEKNIYWNDDLEFIISILIRNIRAIKVADDYQNEKVELYQNSDDRQFGVELLKSVLLKRDTYDAIISRHILNWELERVAIIDRLLIHMAMAEFFDMPSIPARVTINEYIELAKFYSTEKSSMFINGILEKVYVDQKKQGNIHKIGRGLVGDI
ncbi:MAG: transcription antitermination factor NusB [Bacteroidales bacterium]|nr:transcription antitermination factor NusB [Bacteroidales bacterium]HOY38925.1 transcription antitermination factor NusB [Bacteroidales bacterium]HQN92579.1 transcription antitermination factor NusB [Prolixibacteraceae bacterium]